MDPVQALQFFFLLPFGLGLFLGAARIGDYQFETVGHHMAYMSIYSVLSWACYGIGAKVAAWLLRPWRPSLIVVLVAGNVVGGFCLLWPTRDVLNWFFQPYLLHGSAFGPFWPPPPDAIGGYVAITLQGTAWWVLANWADFRFRGVPRFGFAPPPTAVVEPAARPVSTASALPDTAPGQPVAGVTPPGSPVARQAGGEPRLSVRLPPPLRGAEIRALEAEEHYTKVHTSKGNTLLLLRFSDAIVEMEPHEGLQVHRSFWVSRSAVERVARVNRRWVVQLRGGLVVPVSRSYRVTVRAAGLTGGRAMADD